MHYLRQNISSNMRFFIKTIFFGVLALSVSCGNVAATGFEPGEYDNVIVGFDKKSGVITGYFSDQRGDDSISPVFTCGFYFTGILRKNEASLKVYEPTLPDEPSNGKLLVQSNAGKTTIKLKIDDEQPGCMNVYPKNILEKTELKLLHSENFIEIRVVSENKIYISSAPSATTKTKKYLVKGDVIGTIEYRDLWAHIIFIGPQKKTEGWVLKSALYPLLPK